MASLNQRDAGRDFEGNGPSSFDRRDYREAVSDWGSRDGDAEKQIAVDAAIAQIEMAFSSPQARENDAKWRAFYAEKARKAVAA